METNQQQMNQTPQQQVVAIPEDIKAFLDDVLKQANVVYSDEEMHQSLLQELYIRLDKFLFTRMLEELPQEKYNDFIALSSDPAKQGELQTYLQSNIPNVKDFFIVAFADFRDEYLQYLGTARTKQEESIEQDKLQQTLSQLGNQQ